MQTTSLPAELSASDMLNVQSVVTRVAHLIDAGQWKELRALYDAEAVFDYSAFTGEGPQVGADTVVGGWEQFVPGFDRTQHLLGPIDVRVDGDEVVADTHVRARHEIDDTEGGSTWTVGGHYIFRLRTIDDAPSAWKIVYHELADPYVEGNTDLPAVAEQRAADD